ncbi:MAG: hypothetical protein E7271_05725 [Lachnospiraceae bacterium]|nr:hypothetical protein [Lachnospiraceae bacterium]
MMLWEDEEIIKILKLLKNRHRKNKASSIKDHNILAPRFVFICGKEIEKKDETSDNAIDQTEIEETVRELIVNKFNKYTIQNDYDKSTYSVLPVISEKLYTQDIAEDIFSFEKMLAEISQKIIIVTESPGTFCELGAFCMDTDCLEKVTIINEDRDEFKNSFITKGPIKMIENKDEKRVLYHNGIERIKKSRTFQDLIKMVANEDIEISINKKYDNLNLRSLIYEFSNLVELFQPIEIEELKTIYEIIMNFNGNYKISNGDCHRIKTFKNVLFLMERMNIVKKKQGFYLLNPNLSCYNIVSSINRKEYNEIRIRYLNRVSKYDAERLGVTWE